MVQINNRGDDIVQSPGVLWWNDQLMNNPVIKHTRASIDYWLNGED
jgi:hypothetical protein